MAYVNAARLILARELYEIMRSPLLLISMVSLPVMVVGVPLVATWYLDRTAADAAVMVLRELYHLSSEQPGQVIVDAVAINWLPVFLIMPVFLPILIAAQSVAGERERRTIEPLLATPAPTMA